MRIIAGEFRGRRLLAPEGETTRPVTDRVKQSVFDILSPRVEGSVVYDVFAGTGSMGLECLSRGAKQATFFERDTSALKLLRQNIRALNVARSSHVLATDLFKWFETQPAIDASARTSLIFLDPPYRMLRENAEALKALASQMRERHLACDGIVVFRHDSKDVLELPMLQRADLREYSGMTVEFLTSAGV